MAVVSSTCGDRKVVYTGVSEEGEVRDCARCMERVMIDPEEDMVEHLE